VLENHLVEAKQHEVRPQHDEQQRDQTNELANVDHEQQVNRVLKQKKIKRRNFII